MMNIDIQMDERGKTPLQIIGRIKKIERVTICIVVIYSIFDLILPLLSILLIDL